jgi:hypothetical protein
VRDVLPLASFSKGVRGGNLRNLNSLPVFRREITRKDYLIFASQNPGIRRINHHRVIGIDVRECKNATALERKSCILLFRVPPKTLEDRFLTTTL